MKKKSVKSNNPCKSVVQISYNIVKAHGGEMKVESLTADQAGKEEEGSLLIIQLLVY